MIVIGLETHIRLNTRSKLYSRSPNLFSDQANIFVNAVDLAYPGTLPKPMNEAAVRKAITLGLAMNMQVAQNSYAERKSYFYPDLPKGYQITQEHHPILSEGYLEIQQKGITRKIRIKKAHLEEDAGKIIWQDNMMYIDHNRCGAPLLEVVTYPDFVSSDEVLVYLKRLLLLAKYFRVTDGLMEKGSFRSDVNISIMQPNGSLGTRCEIKNLNSFKAIELAIASEIHRQSSSSSIIVQETRGFCEKTGTTYSLRQKENPVEYRYYRDPDIPPLRLSEQYLQDISHSLLTHPDEKQRAYYALSEEEILYLLHNPDTADYYDQLISEVDQTLAYKWLLHYAKNIAKALDIDILRMPTKAFLHILRNVRDGKISDYQGKHVLTVFLQDLAKGKTISIVNVIDRITNQQTDITLLVDRVILAYPEIVQSFQQGETKALQALVGKAIQMAQDKTDPKILSQEILSRLVNAKK